MSDKAPVVHSGAHQAKPACDGVSSPFGAGSRDDDGAAGASGAPLVRTKLHQAPPSPAVPEPSSDALLTDEHLDELRALCDRGGQPGPCCHLAVLRVAGPHPAPCTGEPSEVRRFYVADVLALLDEVTRLRAVGREPPPCIPCGKPVVPTCEACSTRMRESSAELEQALGLQATGILYRVEKREGGWRVEVMNPVVGASGPTREGALAYLRDRFLVTADRLAADMEPPASGKPTPLRFVLAENRAVNVAREVARLLLEGATGIEMNHYERCIGSDRCDCEANAQAARELADRFSKETL